MSFPGYAAGDGYEDAMTWLESQQEADQGFRIAFDEAYAPGDFGPVRGTVDEINKLTGERVSVPWVIFDGSHSDSYIGPVQGHWKNIESPSDFSVHQQPHPAKILPACQTCSDRFLAALPRAPLNQQGPGVFLAQEGDRQGASFVAES